MSNYKVGDEIICIDAHGVEVYLERGHIYVCESFSPCCGTFVHVGHPEQKGHVIICDRCGVENPARPAFFRWRFIKLDKISNDEKDARDTTLDMAALV